VTRILVVEDELALRDALAYTLRQEERLTRRASIWRRTAAGWKIVFHQGTVVADSSPAPAAGV